MEPAVLTRISPDVYRWPSGRLALTRRAGRWSALYDESGLRVVMDRAGRERTFPSPTLAASALGARLPAE